MTPERTTRSKDEAALLETAGRRLPGGVLGSTRFRDDLAFVVNRAQGARIWDVSGREYVDYLLGSGPMFLGHAHPAVVRAVTEQLARGTTYFLVNEPAIILADEPTGNLDSQTSIEIMGILQTLNTQRRITIILVTHEPDIAQYARRVIVFKDGLVVEDRPVTDRAPVPGTGK